MISLLSETAAASWRWLQQELKGRPLGPIVILVGVGDGQLLDALEEHAPATRVLAIEPDPASTRRFLARRNWDSWTKTSRLVYLADPDYAGFNEAWRLFPPDGARPPVLVSPDLVRGDGSDRAKDVLKRILFGVQANADARRRMAPTYLANSIRNVPAVVRGPDLRTLKNAYAGVPAVVVGAGPSLDASLEALGDLADRALLVSTDTAFRSLLTAGIEPQLVVGMDPSHLNLRHFLSLPEHKNSWLVAESALDPQAVAAFDDRMFWFRLANHHPWPWLNEIGIDVGRLDVWGSVLTGAFQVACLLGCDPIVFVGADLAYTDGRPYARATTYEFNWALGAAEGNDLQRVWATQTASANSVNAFDLNGRPARTTETMVSYRDWLLSRVRQSGRRVVNASGAGILTGNGIEHQTLRQILRDAVAIKPLSSFAQPPVTVQRASVAERLISVASGLSRTSTVVGPATPDSPAGEWATFCGERFNPSALREALDAAGAGLANGAEQAMPDWSSFWSRCLSRPLIRETLTRLPEALTSTAPVAPSERAALLRESLPLLDEIRSVVVRAADVAQVGDPATVSTAYTWPETTRWAILTVEALLGRVRKAADAQPPRSIFGAAVRFAGLGKTAINPREPAAAVHACTTLAEQWLRCVAALDPADAAGLRRLLVPHMAAVTPIGVSTPEQARLLTGTLRATSDKTRPDARLLIRPRVLTEEGVDRANVLYATADGAVCLKPHTCETFILREDGSRSIAHQWPRPISGELPWGTAGVVAWSSGFGNPSGPVSPYVMFKRRASDKPFIQRLPVRPTTGAWLDGRLYWICLPAPGENWRGIASFNPGTPGTSGTVLLEIPGELPIDIHVSGGDLLLESCVRRDDFSLQRQVVSRGWRWPGAGPLARRSLGSHGASSSRSTRHGWTATAHPEADAIGLKSSIGTELALNCYYPYKLAWVGRSLLVSTIERELLLFENLAGALDEMG